VAENAEPVVAYPVAARIEAGETPAAFEAQGGPKVLVSAGQARSRSGRLPPKPVIRSPTQRVGWAWKLATAILILLVAALLRKRRKQAGRRINPAFHGL